MNTEPSFESPVENDRAILTEMIVRYHEEDGNTASLDAVNTAVDAIIGPEPLIHGWMIRVNGENAGYLAVTVGYSIETGGRDSFLDELYLEPEFRAQGIGTKAMTFAAEASRELGAKRICLEVEKDNTRARDLYRRLGYEDHDRFLMSRWISEDAD